MCECMFLHVLERDRVVVVKVCMIVILGMS